MRKRSIKSNPPYVIFSTAPNRRVGLRLADILIQRKLAACVQLIPGGLSIYRWKRKVERASETILIIKTRKSNLKKIKRCFSKSHPYDIPELIGWEIQGTQPYLNWLTQEVC